MPRPKIDSEPEQYRGVNNRLGPENLPAGFLPDLQNYRTRTGDIVPRKGVTKPGWLNVTQPATNGLIAPVATFYGVGVFKDPNGVEWTITIADGLAYRHRPHNERNLLPMPVGVKLISRCVPVAAFNKVYLFRGRHLAPLVLRDLDLGFEDLLPVWNSASTYAADAEIAAGPWQAISSITSSGDQATVTTAAEHGYVTGADVTIRGATQAEYNGRYNITVVDAYVFTYQFAGSATTPATGTKKVSNMSTYWQAVGTSYTLTSLTRSSSTATATKAAHGFSNGDSVTIAGAVETEYNGTFVISNVAANTFDYTVTGTPTTPATGTITALNNTRVVANHPPDLYPAEWTQLWTILPNADDAIFINNLLLVPTAYTPGSNDDPATAYNSSSSWTKKDFIVATNVLDEIHFDFLNEFRINQGSDDEIVTLCKYNTDTVIVLKERSWGVLSNLRLGLENVTLDMNTNGYGACARAAVAAGKDVFFPALQRGLISLAQNELGQVRSVDIPFSNDIDAYVKRINWLHADQMRLAYWDDKLFWSVPLDDATQPGASQVAPGATYNRATYSFNGYNSVAVNLIVGRRYRLALGNAVICNTNVSVFPPLATGTNIPAGEFVATQGTYYLVGTHHYPVTATFAEVITDTSNALLVYDFRSQAWQGMDTGAALCVLEFFKPTYNGLERLAFIGADGYISIMEDALEGDQVGNASSTSGLAWTEIETSVTSRGLLANEERPKQFKRLAVVLDVWNARFTVTANTGAAYKAQAVRSAVQFSRTKYLQPFDKAPYADGNGNDDFATPGRGDYSVPLSAEGISLGSTGVALHQTQQVRVCASVRTLQSRYIQFTVTNDQGRCTIGAIGVDATEGQRRDNIHI